MTWFWENRLAKWIREHPAKIGGTAAALTYLTLIALAVYLAVR